MRNSSLLPLLLRISHACFSGNQSDNVIKKCARRALVGVADLLIEAVLGAGNLEIALWGGGLVVFRAQVTQNKAQSVPGNFAR